jgi:peptide/nickel transport system permease protein
VASKRVFIAKTLKEPTIFIGTVIICLFMVTALAAPWLAPYDPYATNAAQRLKGPSLQHPLGTDELGRDVLSRFLYGGRVSISVGVLSVLIGLFIGGALGLVSGYYRPLDAVIMRFVDFLMSFPYMLRAMAIVAILGIGLRNVIIAVGLGGIPIFARLLRGLVLQLRRELYVEAAKAVGAGDLRILRRYILPNAAAPVFAYASLTMATSILSAATLSFLGLGVQPPMAEWGDMAAHGRWYLMAAPHLVVIPALAISVLVLCLNLVGDGVRDALDPRLRK